MFKKTKEVFGKKEIDEDKRDIKLEKFDFLAMGIALSYYMIPALLGIFGLIALIVWVMFN